MITDFVQPGKASFIVGGMFGSEGKGAAAAWLAVYLKQAGLEYDIVTTNAGAQAGHTSVHDGVTRVCFHLPTVPVVVPGSMIYLNAGSIIDPVRFKKELEDVLPEALPGRNTKLRIHPDAAVITPECIEAEGRADSAQSRIASTRKGVGEALARKVLRIGNTAVQSSFLAPYTWSRFDLPEKLLMGAKVLVEAPQGLGLSLNGGFYPHVTSRDCTVAQAASDAGIHPNQVGQTMLVLRTYPIRVGNIEGGHSGGCYPDQQETSWEAINRTPEITTVTGRVRRVFTWSYLQLQAAMRSARPSIVFLTHCDYVPDPAPFLLDIYAAALNLGLDRPVVVCSFGPATSDARIID